LATGHSLMLPMVEQPRVNSKQLETTHTYKRWYGT
jgi:hypothetical protein